jgi:hypothetical protein
MNKEIIQEMILALIQEIDYDHYKFLIPELSEDPEAAEEKMKKLISIAEKYVI